MGGYRQLDVYQKSYVLAKEVYQLTQGFPSEERYGLISQMRRAATSIPMNIAEGYGKSQGEKELLRYLGMAKGSVAEMEVLLDFSCDFEYITRLQHEEARQKYSEAGKMLNGLMESIRWRTTNV